MYYLSTTYFDSGKSELSDHSGYDRHAVASGGPSVGVEGPHEFQAVSLDSSDDHFDTGDPLAVESDSTPHSVWVLTRLLLSLYNDGKMKTVVSSENQSSGGGWEIRASGSGTLRYAIRDLDGDYHSIDWSGFEGGSWYSIVEVWDDDTIYGYAEKTSSALK